MPAGSIKVVRSLCLEYQVVAPKQLGFVTCFQLSSKPPSGSDINESLKQLTGYKATTPTSHSLRYSNREILPGFGHITFSVVWREECVLERYERIVPPGWHVQNQEPVTLQNSEPEPDVAIVRGQLRDFGARHPGPNDIALIVEVADTSLVTDRFKAKLYASAGIPVYWIVNLAERVIEVLSEPTPQTVPTHYAETRRFLPDEEIPVVVHGSLVAHLRVADLLPLQTK